MEDKNKDNLNEEYGEMIPTAFKWIGLEEQKIRADELNKITKKMKNVEGE